MAKLIAMVMLGMLSLGSTSSWLPSRCSQGPAVELILRAERTEGASDAVMERTREIVERRIGALGASATVERQGQSHILVRLGRREDAGPVRALIGSAGRLEFRLVNMDVTPAQLHAGQAPIGSEVLPIAGEEPDGRIAVQRRRLIDGRMIVDARTEYDEQGQPTVIVRFDEAGSRRFARATADNVGAQFAIVLDNVVLSAPVIREPILGGEAQISGSFTVEAANQLAISLRSGPLPIDLVVVEERVPER